MAQIITITITESSEQRVSGIPKTVTMTTNYPSSIFYTLDGTTPTTSSLIYTGELAIPTNKASAVLKAFATDGTDTSAVVTATYSPDISSVRMPRSTVTGDLPSQTTAPGYPYGTPSAYTSYTWGGPGGDIVNDSTVANDPDGYAWDGAGGRTAETDKPLSEYQIVYSETNSQGERGNGIGTLPATVTIRLPDPIPETTDMNSRLFNPKALVIYQDNTKEPFDENISQINRPSFSLEDSARVKDGALLRATGLETQGPTGGFVKSYYNARESTITYYYFDSRSLRWIISKEPYVPTTTSGNLYSILSPMRGNGSRYVYEWVPFKRRSLT